MVLVIGWSLKIQKPNLTELINVLVIVVGVIIACFGEIEFVFVGFLFQLFGVVVESLRLVMIQILLTSKNYKMDPLVGIYYFAPLCGVFNILAFYLFEYHDFKVDELGKVGWFHFFLNALCAFGLNVAVVFLVSIFLS